MAQTQSEHTVLSPKLGGGPHGLGNPNDLSLRKVEIEVLIPKKMRDKAKAEKCVDEVQAFSECCKGASIAMVITCRKENTNLKNCLTRWYQDEDFKMTCQKEYLEDRSEYRRTGIKQKQRVIVSENANK